VPRVKYAMDYRPKNSFSMSYASRKVIFPGGATGEVGLPTPLDFSINSGWNSVPSLPVSLMHTRRLFRVSLVVSK